MCIPWTGAADTLHEGCKEVTLVYSIVAKMRGDSAEPTSDDTQ
jgi:hypothetical protein